MSYCRRTYHIQCDICKGPDTVFSDLMVLHYRWAGNRRHINVNTLKESEYSGIFQRLHTINDDILQKTTFNLIGVSVRSGIDCSELIKLYTAQIDNLWHIYIKWWWTTRPLWITSLERAEIIFLCFDSYSQSKRWGRRLQVLIGPWKYYRYCALWIFSNNVNFLRNFSCNNRDAEDALVVASLTCATLYGHLHFELFVATRTTTT